MADDLLARQMKVMPAFRAMLRAVEARFYEGMNLPQPVLDLGCGDGLFASLALEQPLDAGIDTAWRALREARQQCAYRTLAQARAQKMPFATGMFASAISNSTLEHIADPQAVLREVARVLRPGAPFMFCVPSERFLSFLGISFQS